MKNPIPSDWLPAQPVAKRIICHWSVTGYAPEPECRSSYHILIDYDPKTGTADVHKGYNDLDESAPHTWMANHTIGVSLMCLGGFQSFEHPGPYPLQKAQWDLLLDVCAQLCAKYNILPTKTSLLMHGEVTQFLGLDQEGKWDIGWVPHLGIKDAFAAGNELRKGVSLLLRGGDTGQHVIVRVGSSNMHAVVEDGTTWVPLRAFVAEWNKDKSTDKQLHFDAPRAGATRITIDQGPDRAATAPGGNGSYSIRFVNREGKGWVPLRELLPGVEISVEKWDKSARILVVKV